MLVVNYLVYQNLQFIIALYTDLPFDLRCLQPVTKKQSKNFSGSLVMMSECEVKRQRPTDRLTYVEQ